MEELKKLKTYNRFFSLLLFFNCFVVGSSAILAFKYWHKRDIWSDKYQKNSTQKKQLTRLRTHAFELQEKSKSTNPQEMQWKWTQLSMALGAAMASDELDDALPMFSGTHGTTALIHFVDMKMQKIDEQLANYYSSFSASSHELVWVGLFTFLLGILVPGILFTLFLLSVYRAKKQMTAQISSWAKNFSALSTHDKKDLKDINFWIEMILLTVEEFTRFTDHPLKNYTREIAHAVRSKLRQDLLHNQIVDSAADTNSTAA